MREVEEHDLANMLLANPVAYSGQMDERFAHPQYEWDIERGAHRHYQQVIAEQAAKRLGVSALLAAEQNLGAPPATPLPYEQGRRLILDALAPLGADYVRRFRALLDPANGRLDLSGGVRRANTGTSIVAYDAPVALYKRNYPGTLSNLGVLAHEGGHAIHRELMNANDSLPVYQRSGPHSLFEGYAIFNEWLLLDHAAAARTPADKARALEALLASMAVEVFTSAEETSFEKTLYTTASGQGLLDRPRIDEIYRTSIAPYEYWPMADVGTSRSWMTKSLLLDDPLYLVNYLYAIRRCRASGALAIGSRSCLEVRRAAPARVRRRSECPARNAGHSA